MVCLKAYPDTNDRSHSLIQADLRREPLALRVADWRVQQDRQWWNVFRLHVAVHQEALAILGYIVGKNVRRGNWSAAVDLEQRCGCSGREDAFAVDWHCRQDSAGRDVENFLAVSAPARFTAAAARHLPFSGSAGKRGDVNLPCTGFIGGIGHPFSIGRNLAVDFAALACQEPGWLSAGNWYELKIFAGRNLVREENLLAGQRRRVGNKVVHGRRGEGKALLLALQTSHWL